MLTRQCSYSNERSAHYHLGKNWCFSIFFEKCLAGLDLQIGAQKKKREKDRMRQKYGMRRTCKNDSSMMLHVNYSCRHKRQRYLLFECLPHDIPTQVEPMSQQWYHRISANVSTVISWTGCNVSTATITIKLNWTAVSTVKGMVLLNRYAYI